MTSVLNHLHIKYDPNHNQQKGALILRKEVTFISSVLCQEVRNISIKIQPE